MSDRGPRTARRRRFITASLSAAAHVGLLLVIARAAPDAPPPVKLAPVQVVLVAPFEEPEPPVPPTPEPKAEPEPEPAPKRTPRTPVKSKPPPIKARMARAPAPPTVAPVVASEGPPDAGVSEVGEAELAGAGTAASGAGGGLGCNMTQFLQGKLRRDRRVQAAVSEIHRGKAIRVWDGGWVRHGVQEGAGLAAVREAIQWEVGFAPEACKDERVRGLVVISLADAPGSARIALGDGDWRWTDLLGRRTRR